MNRSLTVVVLAAGKGSRMKSGRAKVLHTLASRTMIGHVLATAGRLEPEKVVVVLANGMEDVEAEVAGAGLPTSIAIQDPQLGTGHALMAAKEQLPESGDILVLYGDTPLLTAGTLSCWPGSGRRKLRSLSSVSVRLIRAAMAVCASIMGGWQSWWKSAMRTRI